MWKLSEPDIALNDRNEPISDILKLVYLVEHNSEVTTCEWYWEIHEWEDWVIDSLITSDQFYATRSNLNN